MLNRNDLTQDIRNPGERREVGVVAGAQRPSFKLGFMKLQELSTKDSVYLINYITTQQSGFPNVLKDEQLLKKPDWMAAILATIAQALKCEDNPAATMLLLNILRSSQFIGTPLSMYFAGMQLESHGPRQRLCRQAIKDALVMFKMLMLKFPNSLTSFLMSTNTLEGVARQLRISTTIIDEEIEHSIEVMVQSRKELLDKEIQDKATHDAMEIGMPKDPPNNFRELGIFPDIQTDIHITCEPFIRPIIVKGGYENAEHYLDVQFRLLREDFIQPLRQGIKNYLSLRSETGARRKLADVRVYKEVNVLNPVCSHSGLHYRVRFDVSRMRHINWNFSKRLIFGSLLCFSKDEFSTIYIATVADRNPDRLKEGELTVQFEVNKAAVRQIRPDEKFLMVETSAYFEAYRHVLDALKVTQERDIPFRHYIVECKNTINSPRYLLTAATPMYNLLPLAEIKQPAAVEKDTHYQVNSDEDDQEMEVEMSPMQHALMAVNILEHCRWPSPETLHLDNSQANALEAALKSEVAIIQGPPGTGKTYIGLKIVQVLLHNKKIWQSNGQNSPILIVCYTNHALDQFLEGISSFLHKGIVRVGGRSKSKQMEAFLLKELRRKVREMRDVPREIFSGRIDALQEMERWQVEIEKSAALIEGTEDRKSTRLNSSHRL